MKITLMCWFSKFKLCLDSYLFLGEKIDLVADEKLHLQPFGSVKGIIIRGSAVTVLLALQFSKFYGGKMKRLPKRVL